MKVEIRDQASVLRFLVRDEVTNETIEDISVRKRDLNSDVVIPAQLDLEAKSFIQEVLTAYRELSAIRRRSEILVLSDAIREAVEYCRGDNATDPERALVSHSLSLGNSAMKRIQREKALAKAWDQAPDK